MIPQLCLPSPLQALNLPEWRSGALRISVKRDDAIHPIVSGNKWRKLALPLAEALAAGVSRIYSFGGAHSNHLHALAYAAGQLGLECHGFVRHDPDVPLTPTLSDCRDFGMRLHYLSRRDYRQRHEPAFRAGLNAAFPPGLWLPEGGYGVSALRGLASLVAEIPDTCDMLLCPVGTGTTLAGLAAAVPDGVRVAGTCARRHRNFIERDIRRLLSEAGVRERGNWLLWDNVDGSGFGPATGAGLDWAERVLAHTGIAFDPVYGAKMLATLAQRLACGELDGVSHLVLIHTGGLQGWRGMTADQRQEKSD